MEKLVVLKLLPVLIMVVHFSSKAQEKQHGTQVLPEASKVLAFYQSQEYLKAAEYIKVFYKEPIRDLSVLMQLGLLSKAGNDYVQAKLYFQRYLQIDSSNASVLFNLASIYQTERKTEKALALYKTVLALDSNNVKTYQALSTMALRQKDLTAAFNYLHQANKLQPYNIDIAFDFGNMALRLKQVKTAYDVFSIALEAHPNELLLIKGKAQTAFYLNKYREAVQLLQTYISLGGDVDAANVLLGEVYYYSQEYNKSLQTFRELGPLVDEMEHTLYLMAMAYKNIGQNKMALVYFDKSLHAAISPNVARYWAEKGAIYKNLGNQADAIHALKKSIEYKPMAASYYALAILYDYELNQKKNAIFYYKRYLNQKPSPEREADIIEFVEERLKSLQ